MGKLGFGDRGMGKKGSGGTYNGVKIGGLVCEEHGDAVSSDLKVLDVKRLVDVAGELGSVSD